MLPEYFSNLFLSRRLIPCRNSPWRAAVHLRDAPQRQQAGGAVMDRFFHLANILIFLTEQLQPWRALTQE
jgi:hypothetical protein